MAPVLRLLTPARLGPIELRNRVVKAATYETRTRGGLVTDELIAWHREFAAGGVAMTTLAYCAVSADGRSIPNQIWLSEAAQPGLARFCAAMHAEGAAAAIQLGHAGRYANRRVTGSQPIGPNRAYSWQTSTWSQPADEATLARLVADHARAAARAVDVGFDALEVHVATGYLLSQFLSPWSNRRTDRWGGSLENRARLTREVLRAVREAAGTRAAVYVKFNMEDGFARGLSASDALAVARLLEADGTVDAFQLTGGHMTKEPLYHMRGDNVLPTILARDPRRLRRMVLPLLTRFIYRDWAFQEAFFESAARRFLDGLRTPLMLLGGVNRLETIEHALADGYQFVALARALIRRPDLVRAYADGIATDAGCTHCNLCLLPVGREPTACPLREPPVAAEGIAG
ncbi:MAG: NADH:flavin oxidoreductase [Candidatus Binatia bacterium]